MTTDWFARPVLSVANVEQTLRFYVERLGFKESWRHQENDQTVVAQAERQGCSLIFSSQWPDKIGAGLMFISLGDDAAVDAVRAECERNAVAVEDGWWGYKVLIVRDPDGNALYFNYSNDNAAR